MCVAYPQANVGIKIVQLYTSVTISVFWTMAWPEAPEHINTVVLIISLAMHTILFLSQSTSSMLVVNQISQIFKYGPGCH